MSVIQDGSDGSRELGKSGNPGPDTASSSDGSRKPGRPGNSDPGNSDPGNSDPGLGTGLARPLIGWRVNILMFVIFLYMSMNIVQATFLGKQVFDMTGNEFLLGVPGLLEFMPVMLLAPLSGMVSDRCDRRKVFAAGLCGEAAASLGLFWYVMSSPVSVAPIFALVMIYATARAFHASASRALPVDLAPEGAVEQIVARSSACWQAGIIVGPLVFGVAFSAHPALPHLLASGVALGAAGLLVAVPGHRPTRAAVDPGIAAAVRHGVEGARFISGNRILLGAISLDLFAVLLGGVVVLLPAIAENRLGVGARDLGVLRAATGAGALTVASVLAVRPFGRSVGRVLLLTVGVFGMATVVLGLTRQFVVALIALVVLSGADAVSVYIRSAIVPLATPEGMRGRVLAVEHVFIGASNELGGFRSGLVARFLGVAGAVVTGGLGAFAVVVLWWRLFPELRSVDRFTDVIPVDSPRD